MEISETATEEGTDVVECGGRVKVRPELSVVARVVKGLP